MTALPAHLPTLVLVCKRPSPGHGKQRLAAAIGTQRAYRLAQLMLDCALEDLCDWPGPGVIAPDHEDHRDWARQCAPFAHCLPQPAGNLGERLNGLDRALRARGHRCLMFIGSDAPALTAADYRRVSASLQEHDTALLDARDGGVVLMASSRPWPELAPLPWSSATLGQALAQACRAAGQFVASAGESFDVDERQDLAALAAALRGDPRPARRRLLEALVEHAGDPA